MRGNGIKRLRWGEVEI
jgi:hypothetical protein